MSNINKISLELEKAKQLEEDIPESVGMLSIKSANQVINDAISRPDPTDLWHKLWYEGEVCCLFADSNLGKSIYAVQIGTHIAENERVLYFDFELSEKQFQMRYTDESTKEPYHFPDNFYRVEIDPEAITTDDFEDAIITDIENAAQQTKAKVLIIDNLTYLCNSSEKGDKAGSLMIKLMQLKRKYSWSILVLAHTPKRQNTNAITQNDLAGSKKLCNFFDSVFAIGKSAKNERLRYIKQIKVRYGEFTYDSDNIMVCEIKKEDSFLKFVFLEYGTEPEHLKIYTEQEKEELRDMIISLHNSGKSYRSIASELGCSLSKVQRTLKKK